MLIICNSHNPGYLPEISPESKIAMRIDEKNVCIICHHNIELGYSNFHTNVITKIKNIVHSYICWCSGKKQQSFSLPNVFFRNPGVMFSFFIPGTFIFFMFWLLKHTKSYYLIYVTSWFHFGLIFGGKEQLSGVF